MQLLELENRTLAANADGITYLFGILGSLTGCYLTPKDFPQPVILGTGVISGLIGASIGASIHTLDHAPTAIISDPTTSEPLNNK
jgi:membrane associated rhomboid family serine protease